MKTCSRIGTSMKAIIFINNTFSPTLGSIISNHCALKHFYQTYEISYFLALIRTTSPFAFSRLPVAPTPKQLPTFPTTGTVHPVIFVSVGTGQEEDKLEMARHNLQPKSTEPLPSDIRFYKERAGISEGSVPRWKRTRTEESLVRTNAEGGININYVPKGCLWLRNRYTSPWASLSTIRPPDQLFFLRLTNFHQFYQLRLISHQSFIDPSPFGPHFSISSSSYWPTCERDTQVKGKSNDRPIDFSIGLEFPYRIGETIDGRTKGQEEIVKRDKVFEPKDRRGKENPGPTTQGRVG